MAAKKQKASKKPDKDFDETDELKKTSEQKEAEAEQGSGAKNPMGTQGGVPITGKNTPETTGDVGDYDQSRKAHSASGADDHRGQTLGRKRLNERGGTKVGK